MPSARIFQLTIRSVGGGGGRSAMDQSKAARSRRRHVDWPLQSSPPRLAPPQPHTLHMLPLSLLRTAAGHPMVRRTHAPIFASPRRSRVSVGLLTQLLIPCRAQLVELKNGETYNGELVSCDNWMNIRCACECIVVPKSVGTRPHANSTVARSLTFNVFACLAACAASSAPRATATDFGGCRR